MPPGDVASHGVVTEFLMLCSASSAACSSCLYTHTCRTWIQDNCPRLYRDPVGILKHDVFGGAYLYTSALPAIYVIPAASLLLVQLALSSPCSYNSSVVLPASTAVPKGLCIVL